VLCTGALDRSWSVACRGVASGPGAAQGKPAGKHQPTPTPTPAGECKCTGTPGGLPGMNVCTDNSASFYIGVSLKPGAHPVCLPYKLIVQNGG
jgi:hypothetical protein